MDEEGQNSSQLGVTKNNRAAIKWLSSQTIHKAESIVEQEKVNKDKKEDSCPTAEQ